jgi:hypothetical protein
MAKSYDRLIHNMSKDTNTVPVGVVFLIAAVCLALGTLTGFVSSRLFGAGGTKTVVTSEKVETTADGTPKSAGVKDTAVFKDSAEGKLVEGGFEGEGSFHLQRPGGESQNVYLTSTTVDLSQFVGKEVKVLGKTFDSEKVGWLMDVGYIEVK